MVDDRICYDLECGVVAGAAVPNVIASPFTVIHALAAGQHRVAGADLCVFYLHSTIGRIQQVVGGRDNGKLGCAVGLVGIKFIGPHKIPHSHYLLVGLPVLCVTAI